MVCVCVWSVDTNDRSILNYHSHEQASKKSSHQFHCLYSLLIVLKKKNQISSPKLIPEGRKNWTWHRRIVSCPKPTQMSLFSTHSWHIIICINVHNHLFECIRYSIDYAANTYHAHLSIRTPLSLQYKQWLDFIDAYSWIWWSNDPVTHNHFYGNKNCAKTITSIPIKLEHNTTLASSLECIQQ
jgi:hypothetical protein